MTETIIEALIKLFAIITNVEEEKVSGNGRQLVMSYLSENFNNELMEKYLSLYNESIELYHEKISDAIQQNKGGKNAFNQPFINEICEKITLEYDLFNRIILIIQLLEFIKKENKLTREEISFVDFIAENFKVAKNEYEDIKNFVLFNLEKIKDRNQLCLVNGNEKNDQPDVKHIYNFNQVIDIYIFRIHSTNTFIFKYNGARNLYLSGHKLPQNKTYVLVPGSVLRTSRIRPIYYGRILAEYTHVGGEPKITFCANNIEYKFDSKNFGVHKFNFCEESGQMIGIMGGSGAGKSTLLNVLNGNLKLNAGKIIINGYDLHKDKEHLKGLIGYVPQDDMLIEELTVYENLYYNAKLCFSDFSEDDIARLINKSLVDFDLVEAKNLKVGKPLKKIISGGQRKRLNIALELIREPAILFVDEPTSGLSSMDSEKVMNLLKRQTLKGKLVITVIHQPSSDVYKLFDRIIIMDKGGYVVFNGNPVAAITYFKKQANFINAEESECLSCGNIKAEQPLRIIEARMVNPDGRFVRKRKTEPEDWYKLYIQKYDDTAETGMQKFSVKKRKLPKSNFHVPDRLKQLKIYSLRNLAAKLANSQYILITLIEAPLLAIILSVFSRYNAGSDANPGSYIFSENVNIPAYLFMSVVVALFLGLIQSAEEIFKDKRLLKRESFLNLSRFSFLGSKVLFLFTLSAIQMFIYTLIGNSILGIKGMLFSYWLILFSTSCFANMVGLNLSSGLSSAVAIYILIPLLLIPEILFSGAVVDFKKLPGFANNPVYSPLIGVALGSRSA